MSESSLALARVLAGEVRQRRGRLRWTRRELANRTGVSERFLAEIEAGRANPSVLTICDLAAAFECEPVELLGGHPPARAKSRSNPPIALLGLRGAGKSTVGRELSVRLGLPFVELDAEVERRTGMKLGQIFELNGESSFRRSEREALRALLDDDRGALVIATGGGIVTDPETFALLRERTWTVWLEARPQDHWQRVVAQGDTRPMQGQDAAFDGLVAILDQRRRLYSQAAITVQTSGRDVRSIAEAIAVAWPRHDGELSADTSDSTAPADAESEEARQAWPNNPAK
ncbi:MAG: shikimate kinase [Planctomycetota bacterium]